MQGRVYRLLLVATILISMALSARAQTSYDTSPQGQTGEQVYGSYFGTDIDTIGLYNGNLTVSIPLFSLPGRELPYGLTLTYNSQKWESNTCSGSPCGQYTGGWQKANLFGGTPSFFATFLDCENNPNNFNQYNAKYEGDVYWIDGSGAKHRYKGTVWNTQGYCVQGGPSSWDNLTLNSLDSDGSTFLTGNYMSYGSAPAQINLKNGNVRYFRDHGATSPSYDYASPNGNYLTNSAQNQYIFYMSGLPAQDTLGRSVTYSPWNGTSETYTVTDSNGVHQTYTLNWTGTNLWDAYAQTWDNWTPRLTSIVLPNGKSYSFVYNDEGFITQVTLPSGAYIKYVYSPSLSTSACYDQVLERHVSPDGTAGSEQVWKYSGNSGVGCYASSRAITVTSPLGDMVVHSLNAQGEETEH